ncbi:MAG: DUF2177 family protein [Janthinobacterium lividum]
MSRYLIAYIASGVVFFALDFAYLSLAGVSMFRHALGDWLADPMRLGAGLLFYLVYFIGLIFFAVAPAFETQSLGTAVLRGAMLGLIAYTTYELTNYATLARWNLTLVLVDTIWGIVVSAVAAGVGYRVALWLGR